jgi:hypothetical protein
MQKHVQTNADLHIGDIESEKQKKKIKKNLYVNFVRKNEGKHY